jgi:membrane-bound metal-dependent hydrolase YbcI (DUF457 family)
MPSPLGHVLGGVLTAWLADLVPPAAAPRAASAGAPWFERVGDGLTLTCAVLAACPDVDLLFDRHRMGTHSIGAVLLVAGATAIISAWRGRPVRRLTLTCAAAYGSHLLLDWMAIDNTIPRGVPLWWPFDHRYYISGWDLFRHTERRAIFSSMAMKINVLAVLQEMLILMPPLAAVWLIRIKTLARFPAEIPCGDHPPQ